MSRSPKQEEAPAQPIAAEGDQLRDRFLLGAPQCMAGWAAQPVGIGEQPSITDRDPGDEDTTRRDMQSLRAAVLAWKERYAGADLARIGYEERIAVLEMHLGIQRARAQFWHDLANVRLSAGWENLPDVTAPEPERFPARALARQAQRIGIISMGDRG